jgi:hypothetical protein
MGMRLSFLGVFFESTIEKIMKKKRNVERKRKGDGENDWMEVRKKAS